MFSGNKIYPFSLDFIIMFYYHSLHASEIEQFVLESDIKLKHIDGALRQIVVKNNGRKQPVFIVANDFDISIKKAVLKYAGR